MPATDDNEFVNRTLPQNPNPWPLFMLERKISIGSPASAAVAVNLAWKSNHSPLNCMFGFRDKRSCGHGMITNDKLNEAFIDLE